jgi:transposase
MQIAVIATARKLAVLCWHLIVKGEDYAYGRPSPLAQKLRALELAPACSHAVASAARPTRTT